MDTEPGVGNGACIWRTQALAGLPALPVGISREPALGSRGGSFLLQLPQREGVEMGPLALSISTLSSAGGASVEEGRLVLGLWVVKGV